MSDRDESIRALLQAAALRFANDVAEALALRDAPAPREPYHQGNLPPGETKRSYLDKASRGDFKAAKTGRAVICRPEDWDAYVAGRTKAPRPRARPLPREPEPSDEELLRSVGVKLRRKAG